MIDIKLLFDSLLKNPEVKKIDFKGNQYHLDNEILKSQFVKDILCMANTPGGDGYIVIGVVAQGNQRTVVGLSHHLDSATLEELVASVVEEPIHFEYLPLECEGQSCAIIFIPSSKAVPHWPKKDLGKLKKHVFYIRRSSGNREASISEIREMFLSSIRMTDISRLKPKSSLHITDELASFDIKQRTQAMYDMLEKVIPKVPIKNYSLFDNSNNSFDNKYAVFTSTNTNVEIEFATFMYPITATKDSILYARLSLCRLLDYYLYYMAIKDFPKRNGMLKKDNFRESYNQIKYERGKSNRNVGRRLLNCQFVHISYQKIYSKYTGLNMGGLLLENNWSESWGNIIKWKSHYPEKHFYEFFIPNVTSELEMTERLKYLISWTDSHPL